MKDKVNVDYPILPHLQERWSPRAFDESEMDDSTLRRILEAARWAPSCFNEQPWHFLVARRQEQEGFRLLLSCLNEFNQQWAKRASVLMITAARCNFAENGKDNRHALHDVGLAVAQLTVQATALGYFTHQMAGFSEEKVRTQCKVSEGFTPVTGIAIGRQGAVEVLPDALQEKELAPQRRRPQAEFVFGTRWGQALESKVVDGSS
ncbi:MAG: nitroreductase family protein [Polyangiales bacterium]